MRAALRGLTPAVVGLMMAALMLIRFEHTNPVLMLAVAGILRVVLQAAWGL